MITFPLIIIVGLNILANAKLIVTRRR